MNGIVVVVLVFFALAGGLGVVAYFVYQGKLRRAKSIERGLKMVPLLIHLPPPSNDTTAGGRDIKDVMREKTAQAEVLYNLIAGTATAGFKSSFYGQRHVALELVAAEGMVHFYVAVPVNLVGVIEKAVLTAYPGAKLEEVEDHNIFSQQGRLSATLGGELVLKTNAAYPIATYATLDRDPLQALLTTMGSLPKTDGAAVQIMIRPASPGWVRAATKLTMKLRRGRQQNLAFGVGDLAKAAIKTPTVAVPHDLAKGATNPNLSQLELTAIEQIEEKTKRPGFEVLVRVLVSADSVSRSQTVLQQLATSFALFERPGLNGFKFMPAVDVQGLVTAFIFRFFPPELHGGILNSAELATMYHLPDSQFTPTTNVTRQMSKEVDGPATLPSNGLLFGYNEFRGVRKEIRMSTEDRRRHTYILGQTGTGKSTMLENLIVQDMLAGNGFAFIDPHGDSAEKMLSLVPKNRAEDVVYFNPADMDYPLGLNLFEFDDPKQKDFLIQESLSMLYKLYDPNGTGVIGPRFEQWYRNAALTLMADPDGATFIEIPKVFTDTDYLKHKFKYLTDPTVVEFWTKEMGQTSDYHKSEMLGYFVSKFGAFQQNEMMRNIIGQTKSAFNFRDIMDNKKILIVNLSKGQVGEMNAKLLGMMLVIKFQAAAMSRANVPEAERNDFCLYVDEFQNFSTDSFASILSEARKYRLNLIVGNQFMGQLTSEIREAVFGNIGTILAHRMGPEDAEFMVKQYSPIFDASDLMNLPNYHSAARLMIGGLPSQPFTMNDLPPVAGSNPELGAAIKQLSAAKFGLAKAVVEADVEARLSNRPVVPAPSTPLTPVTPTEPPKPVDVAAPSVAPALPSAPVAEPPALPESAPTASATVVAAAPVAAEPAPVTAPAMSEPVAPSPESMPTPVATVTVPEVAPVVPAPQLATPSTPVEAAPVAQSVPNEPTSTPASAPEPTMAQPAPIIAADEVEDVTPEPQRTAIGQPLPTVAAPTTDNDAPPIGAPPVELPAAAVLPVPVPKKDTLSISDITGRKTPAAPLAAAASEPVGATPNPADVELIPAGAEPPAPVAANEPVPLADRVEPALVYDPATDPHANIELLGSPAPAIFVDAVAATPEKSEAQAAVESTYDPTQDPNAAVPLVAADLAGQFELPTAPVTPTAVPVPADMPVPEIMPITTPQPAAFADAAAEPVPLSAPPETSNVADDDELPIHFLDPSLEAVLNRPVDAPPIELATEVATAPAPVPEQPIVTPVAEQAADDTAMASDAVLEPKVAVAASPVAATATLVQTPPPIGAPPVDLGSSVVTSEPTVAQSVSSAPSLPPAALVPVPATPEPAQPAAAPASPALAPVADFTTTAPAAAPTKPELASISSETAKQSESTKPATAEVKSDQPAAALPVPVKPELSSPAKSPAAVEPEPVQAAEPDHEPQPVAKTEVVAEAIPAKVVDDAVAALAALGGTVTQDTPAETPSKHTTRDMPQTAKPTNEPTAKPEAETVVKIDTVQPAMHKAEPESKPNNKLVTSDQPGAETAKIAHQALPGSENKPADKAVVEPVAKFADKPEVAPTSSQAEPDQAKPTLMPATVAPALETATVQPPKDKVKPAEVVAKTEAAIDDLLSTSLIKPNSQQRLPEVEPAAAATKPAEDKPEGESGRHWVGSALPQDPGDETDDGEVIPTGEDQHSEPRYHSTSHKVIQPLAPIESGKDRLAEALKAEAAAEAASAQAVAPPAPAPIPVAPPQAPPAPLTPPVQPAAPIAVEEDVELPEAESLAAGDVAQKREADRVAAAAITAQQAAQAAVVPQPVAMQKPAPAEHKPAKPHHRPERDKKPAEHKPEPEAAPAPVAQPEPASAAPAPAKEEPLIGKLIMPSTASQAHNEAPQAAKRPDKLAKGEVFVDESGNVIIGE